MTERVYIPSTFSLGNHLLRSVLDAEKDSLRIHIEQAIPMLRRGCDQMSMSQPQRWTQKHTVKDALELEVYTGICDELLTI
jgi:hypothetical protein